MTNFLIGFIITILSLLIGYWLGLNNSGNIEQIQKTKRLLSKLNPLRDNKVGAVPRPTAQDIIFRDKPWLKEEDEEMTKALDNLNK